MKKIIYKKIIEEVSVLNKNKSSLTAYKKNGWTVFYEGKHGTTLRKTTTEGKII